jgi:hypothetical protein
MKGLSEDASEWGGGAEGAPVSPELDIADIAARLRQDARSAAIALLGKPNRKHSNKTTLAWGNNGSLKVVVAGPKCGQCFDHEAGVGGDILWLAGREKGGMPAALSWACVHLGLEGGAAPETDPAVVAEREAKREADRTARDAEAAKAAAEKREKALALWNEGQPVQGTQAEQYLAARGVTLPEGAPVRFLEAAPDNNGKRYPAMMVLLAAHDGAFCAVQLTFLDREGAPKKAVGANPPKMTKGSYGNGAVWLTAPGAHAGVVIAEGVETVLSMWAADPTAGAVAVIGTRYKAVDLPPSVQDITIGADIEPAGKGVPKARDGAERWAAEGRTVRLAFPGPRYGAKCDFNDLLRQGPGGVATVRAALEAAEPFVSDIAAKSREKVFAMMRGGRSPKLPSNVHPQRFPTLGLRQLPAREAEQNRLNTMCERWARAAVRYAAWAGLDEQAKRAALRDLVRERPELVEAEWLAKTDPKHKERADFLSEREADHVKARTRALRHAGWDRYARAPETAIIRATAGLGKTHALIAALAWEIENAPVPVLFPWLVPAHELAAGAVARFAERGVSALVLGGRDRDDAQGRPLCERKELADSVATAGLSVRRTVCERPGMEPCEHRATCGYFRQPEALPDRGVVIATHHAAANQLPAGVRLWGRNGGAGPMVIDESSKDALAAKWKDDTLAALRGVAREAETDEQLMPAAPVLHRLADLLERVDLGGAGWRNFLDDAGVTSGGVNEAAAAIRGTLPRSVGSPDDEGSIMFGLNMAQKHRPRRIALAALEALALDMRMERPTLATLRAWDAPGEGGGAQRKYRVMPPPVLAPDAALSALILDASAEPAIYEALLGRPVRVERFDVEPSALVVQITQPSFSHSALGLGKQPKAKKTGDEAADKLAAKKAAERRAAQKARRDAARDAVRAVVRRHGTGGKVLVIVPKPLRILWTGVNEPKGITEWEAEGCLIGHHNALRGLDDAKGCEAVLVIGRPFPPREAIEDEARGIFARHPEPLVGMLSARLEPEDEASQFNKARRPLLMRDGFALDVDTLVHADPRCEALRRHATNEEVVQGAHRIRPVQAPADRPKLIYILSDVAHDMVVDRVMDFDTWRKWLDVSAAMVAGALPFNLEALRSRAPAVTSWRGGKPLQDRRALNCVDEFSQEAVLQAVRFRATGRQMQFPNGIYIGEIAAAPHLAGIGTVGERKLRLLASAVPIQGGVAAPGAELGCEIVSKIDIMPIVDESIDWRSREVLDNMVKSLTELHAAEQQVGTVGAVLPSGPGWEYCKQAIQRMHTAMWDFMAMMSAANKSDFRALADAAEWPPQRQRSTEFTAHALLDVLDPFIDALGRLCPVLPDGRCFSDNEPEAERLGYLLRALGSQGRTVPEHIARRPFARQMLAAEAAARRARRAEAANRATDAA